MISDVMITSFLTLAKTLNFTNAAKELYLSQQAVSKHISRLEEALDCQLFTRERGNIQLTKAGQVYLEVFQQYEASMAEAKVLVKRLTHREEKNITVGYLDLLDISELFYPILMSYKDKNPDVVFEYRSTPDWELPAFLRDGKIDVAITFDSEMEKHTTEDIESIVIGRAREMLFVAKDHPLATKDANYHDFKDENVFFSLPPSGNINGLLKRMESYGFPYENLVIADNMLSSCTAIEMGQGVSFAIDPCKLINKETFATYPTEHVVQIILCYRKTNENPILPLFIEMTKKYIKENPEILELH
jgi:DNA-binding transcriptional LysR family regulator